MQTKIDAIHEALTDLFCEIMGLRTGMDDIAAKQKAAGRVAVLRADLNEMGLRHSSDGLKLRAGGNGGVACKSAG